MRVKCIYKWYFLVYLGLLSGCDTAPDFDLFIVNGFVHVGDGEPGEILHIGINADTIAYIGTDPFFTADRIVDARGKVVSPGFIDPHTHADRDLKDSLRKANLNYLFQGVTTVFIGSDGRNNPDLAVPIQQFQQQGIGTNVGLWVGHNSIRKRIMGMRSDAPTSEELEQMKLFVDQGMKAGAIGLSSGLYYAPGSYSNTEEVIALAKVVANYGGVYDAHIRDESTYSVGLLAAVAEMISVAREAGVPSHIAHIKCLGVDVWEKSDTVIKMVEEARAEGLAVTADQYPYEASGTSIVGALVPRWVLADDPDPLPKFEDPTLRGRIMQDMEENLRKRGGPERLLLTSARADSLVGRTLAQLAEAWKLPPVEAAIEVLKLGGSSLASFNMQESDITDFMRQPWVMTSSDGSTGHPRKYGAFAKKIREYVREKRVLNLEEMIHKSSGLTAQTFKINKRGLLKKGYYADVIIFDPDQVHDQADFEEPTQYAAGMEYVLVNGKITIDQGIYVDVLNGVVVKRGGMGKTRASQ